MKKQREKERESQADAKRTEPMGVRTVPPRCPSIDIFLKHPVELSSGVGHGCKHVIKTVQMARS